MFEKKFAIARERTEEICSLLETEDYVVQPMEEVSPPKWHLGHTTWFLEELILKKQIPSYQFHHPGFRKIFNSYYKGLGEHWVQGERGRLSRPSVREIFDYRAAVDDEVLNLYKQHSDSPDLNSIMELAINHEEQHQELLLMDIKNILGANPLLPAYSKKDNRHKKTYNEKWIEFPKGIYEVGADRRKNFAFDNETPVHKVYLNSFAISDHMITNGEYLHFIQDKGYAQPKLWLSKGWDWLKQRRIQAPLYWQKNDDEWMEFTLYGEEPLDPSSPVCHISYFEADAFARWMGLRLPTEAEFEICETEVGTSKSTTETYYHPLNPKTFQSQLWSWTSSHYSPYPGFKPFEGEVQEYNGKFMCNQFILRGGCFATPAGHYRKTYRNFYEPDQRWMFSGIALAKDLT